MPKQNNTNGEERDSDSWRIDGKKFSMGELTEGLDYEFDMNDSSEVKFNFSGDYSSLKKHIEKFPSDRETYFEVSNIVNLSNEGNKLSKDYTIIVRRRK